MNFGAHDVYSQHVVEAVSDSNFATDRATRKSLSSGHVYIDRCLMFSFVRSQKVVTLSSGEAELVALTQTVGESILIHKAWEFLTRAMADHVARSDSSVARAIASRLGVGRVKHLQTSSLWIQQWVHRKELRVAAIGTALNPTDMGTKILSANRLRMLCAVAGMVDDGGNKVGKEELQAELCKTKGVNAKTLHLVQLLMASTLQGCIVENYEDTHFYLLFFLELVGTFYEEHPTYFVFFVAAVLLLTTVFLCYLNGVQWRLSFHIGRGPKTGLEPGYWTHRATRDNEPNQSEQTDPNTEDSQSEQTEPNTEDSPHEQTEPDTENSSSATMAEQGQRRQGRECAAGPRGGRPHERVDGKQCATTPGCSTGDRGTAFGSHVLTGSSPFARAASDHPWDSSARQCEFATEGAVCTQLGLRLPCGYMLVVPEGGTVLPGHHRQRRPRAWTFPMRTLLPRRS